MKQSSKSAVPVKPKRAHTVPLGGLRLGLCCRFISQPIKFRVTTATVLQRLPRREQLLRVAGLCEANAAALFAALWYGAAHRIGSFRIRSPILPVKTHPQVGYRVEDLPGADEIVAAIVRCGGFVHISSPLAGWRGSKPERHHDHIHPKAFPAPWRGWPLTVEVEAKAKELAVSRPRRWLEHSTRLHE